MTARTHDVFAFASLITVANYFPPTNLNLTTTITGAVGCVIGSLLPDIDQASNRLWSLLPAGNITGKILRKLFLAHRTLSHSLIGILLFYFSLNYFLGFILNPNYINHQIVLYAIMIGFISHLIADSFTEEGIPLFFPLKLKIGFPPISSWRIKTGKGFEKFIVFPAIIIYIFWFTTQNHQQIINILKLTLK